MAKITKEDLKHAFLTKQRKRNRLLYDFYRNEYFSHGYTARFIAEKITADLGVPISENMIYLIFYRIMKKGIKQVALSPIGMPSLLSSTTPEGKEKGATAEAPKKWEFKNAEDYPKEDPFKGALKNL